jgi:AAA+ ATPase superfamily predicted ATPase
MATWSFYGRDAELLALKTLVATPRWFFCRIQGRRRIGKTALLTELAGSDPSLAARLLYMQVPDSDERDVVNTFARTLAEADQKRPVELAESVVDFPSMAAALGQLCRAGFIVVLDEFQYFNRAALSAFNSFLQAQVDVLRDTEKGGLFVLGSIQAEMEALLDDKGVPLYGRLTNQRSLHHWDFEDLQDVFKAHDVLDPYQWLTLWTFFEGVPKFYRDAYEQDLFKQPSQTFASELLRQMFIETSSTLAEEADTWFLREIRGRGVSVLNFLAGHPGCTNGDLTSALTKDGDATALGNYISRLVNNYQLVDKRLPVFSESNSRSARYYITDNFLQAWLAVAKPAKEAARLRPTERAVEIALPRLQRLEGYSFEKLIKQLHVECSQKGVGDFALSEINMGYWNRARNTSRAVEIDLVALDNDNKRVRFGSCKRSADAHDNRALADFDRHIEAFSATKEGRSLKDWAVEKVCFSPIFTSERRDELHARGFESRDLRDYASLF